MKEIEEWKDIPDYKGFYQASSFGRIRSLDRNIKYSNGRTSFVKGKILKESSSCKYLTVRLCKNGVCKTQMIHVLIAIVFHNHKPNKFEKVVNHKDFNTVNNYKNNLEVVEHRDNTNKLHLKSSSKYIGVSWLESRNKWQSRIFINGKNKFLGYFIKEENANIAYQKALNNYLKNKKNAPIPLPIYKR